MRVLAITTVVFLVTTIIFGVMAFAPNVSPITPPAASDPDDEILEVATRFSENLTTFDHSSLDEDLARLESDITPGFQEQVHDALGGDINDFRQAILDSQAISTGEIKGASVSSRDDDTATVLAVVAQTVRNEANPEPRTQLRPLELTLVETDSGWKVDVIGNPVAAT